MRIIDYYNYFATAAFIIACAVAVVLHIRKKKSGQEKALLNDRMSKVFFAFIVILASALRVLFLSEVPLGLQQDEASIGYEAYILANFGVDRNGYAWPVYPITWGCGGGSPLLIYLNVLSIKLFGTGIVKLRLIPAVLGVVTVILFYFTLRLIFEEKIFRNEISLFGAFFLTICPWHVILSRWSLDCNIMPFNVMLSAFLFMVGAKRRKTLAYVLSAVSFALCMYSYGSATIVVPVFLLIMCIYALVNKFINIKQLVISFAAFMIVFAPLLWFYAVNYLGFPEFVSEYFCVNKLTAARGGEAFISLDGSFLKTVIGNLKIMIKAVSVGDSSFTLVHSFPGYASLFEFTFPATLLGFIITVKEVFFDKKGNGIERLGSLVFIGLTLATAVLCMVIVPDISRMVTIFIPAIYFFTKGMLFVLEESGKLFSVLTGVIVLATILFCQKYFTEYNIYANSIFMPGYGDAMKRAYEIAGDENMIYSTYDGLSAPFMLALYYNNYDPHKFTDSVVYFDETAEFRIAESFGNFMFELPKNLEEELDEGAVVVLSSDELFDFEEAKNYNIDGFGAYWVLYR